MTESTVLIVDDISANRLVLSTMLEDDYRVLEADSGASCLEIIAASAPDIVLLDVNMPEMNGYEVCTELRRQEQTAALPVIFISGLDSAEERLAGYEAGGNEYLIKPVDEDDLRQRIEKHLDRRLEVSRTRQEADEAMTVAMEAMTSSSEIGQLLNFVKDSQNSPTLEDMGELICEAADRFGLNACAVVEGAFPRYFGCEQGSMAAQLLEKSLLSQERVMNLGVRTIVKSDLMALLIKNMPVQDESRYGRFKDHLVVLVGIAEGRLATLRSQLDAAESRKAMLQGIIGFTEKQLAEFHVKFNRHEDAVRQMMSDLMDGLESELFRLSLDEDQEKVVMDMVARTGKQVEASSQGTKDITADLDVILQGMRQLLSRE